MVYRCAHGERLSIERDRYVSPRGPNLEGEGGAGHLVIRKAELLLKLEAGAGAAGRHWLLRLIAGIEQRVPPPCTDPAAQLGLQPLGWHVRRGSLQAGVGVTGSALLAPPTIVDHAMFVGAIRATRAGREVDNFIPRAIGAVGGRRRDALSFSDAGASFWALDDWEEQLHRLGANPPLGLAETGQLELQLSRAGRVDDRTCCVLDRHARRDGANVDRASKGRDVLGGHGCGLVKLDSREAEQVGGGLRRAGRLPNMHERVHGAPAHDRERGKRRGWKGKRRGWTGVDRGWERGWWERE